mmetsp:Transcript_34158/g.53262  ORF Transcript_34158/g.53262 Transcript_34158/m.53262 type:complete len:297 (-) Transcript_34158:621-1511(-)
MCSGCFLASVIAKSEGNNEVLGLAASLDIKSSLNDLIQQRKPSALFSCTIPQYTIRSGISSSTPSLEEWVGCGEKWRGRLLSLCSSSCPDAATTLRRRQMSAEMTLAWQEATWIECEETGRGEAQRGRQVRWPETAVCFRRPQLMACAEETARTEPLRVWQDARKEGGIREGSKRRGESPEGRVPSLWHPLTRREGGKNRGHCSPCSLREISCWKRSCPFLLTLLKDAAPLVLPALGPPEGHDLVCGSESSPYDVSVSDQASSPPPPEASHCPQTSLSRLSRNYDCLQGHQNRPWN